MSDYNHEAFGGSWETGQDLVEDLMSHVLTHIIKKVAKSEGKNVNNPRRIGAFISGSLVTSFILGPTLGPLGALFGSLISACAAYGGECEDDWPDSGYNSEMIEAKSKLTAASIATRVLREHVTQYTWECLCDNINGAIDRAEASGYKDTNSPLRAFEFAFNVVKDAIYDTNQNIYDNYMTVYNAALQEME